MLELEVNGETVEFRKASQSHIDGKECLYVGRGSDGTVFLTESNDAGTIIRTTERKLQAFVSAYTAGEFDLAN